MLIDLRSGFDDTIIPNDYLMERMRVHRNRLLAESDWTVLPHSPMDQRAWSLYRQSLRDFPETWTPSETVWFPNPP